MSDLLNIAGAVTIERLQTISLAPQDADSELHRFYRALAASEDADEEPRRPGGCDLPIIDFLTVRDILDLSGLRDGALHALLVCMFMAMREGSLCLRVDHGSLSRRLNGMLGNAETGAKWAARIVSFLKSRELSALLAAKESAFLPLVRPDGQDAIYFHRLYCHEQILKSFLRRRLVGKDDEPLADATSLAGAIDDVLRKHPPRRDGTPLRLNDEQQIAAALSLMRRFVVISGGPGTGKTSIIFSIARCLLRLGVAIDRIRIAAPTGRAAQRICDFVQANLGQIRDSAGNLPESDAPLEHLSATTVHRLLRYNPASGSFVYGADSPLPADVIIIDEVSMVDAVLMGRLAQAIQPDARLILLGDKDQLPSVEAGAVLANLMPGDDVASYSSATIKTLQTILPGVNLPKPAKAGRHRDAVVILRQNYRSQKHIQSVAARINAQDASIVDELPKLSPPGDGIRWHWPDAAELILPKTDERGGCRLIDAGDADLARWQRILDAWAEHHYLKAAPGGKPYVDLVRECEDLPGDDAGLRQHAPLGRLCELLNAARVLTLPREGPFGAAGVNRHLSNALRRRFDPMGQLRLFSGAPVMIAANDHLKQIYNGDVGVVLRDRRGGYRAIFPRNRGYVSYGIDALPEHDLAFAVTVHKAQGSEYNQILLPLPAEKDHRLLTKEIIYTAITRAKELAVIHGGKDVLRHAIERHVERDSGLGLWEEC